MNFAFCVIRSAYCVFSLSLGTTLLLSSLRACRRQAWQSHTLSPALISIPYNIYNKKYCGLQWMRLPRHFVPRSDIKGASRSVGVSRSDRELGVSRVENFFMRYALGILYFLFVIARHVENMSWQSHTLLPTGNSD